MKLIVVRHGQTKENALGICQGVSIGGELSEKGIEQVKRLAERLKNEKIDVIFSSDLKRTRDTTREIAKYHKVPVYYVKELRECCRGVFEGGHVKKFENERLKDYYNYKPKNGESLNEIKTRVLNFLRKVIEKYKDKTVLIVSHGEVNNLIISNFLRQDNACINILEVENINKGKIHKINDLSHLEEY